MLFRDFKMIAAIGYAAEQAAGPDKPYPVWDELNEEQQNEHIHRALAVARGEKTVTTDDEEVFIETCKSIFNFNDGQGLLALEDLMNLGSVVMSLGLRTEDEVSERNIREDITELLQELAERRQGGSNTITSSALTDADVRENALAAAVRLTDQTRQAGRAQPQPTVEAAQTFYEFMSKPSERPYARFNALHQAVRVSEPGMRATTVVLLAEDFMSVLEPAPAEPKQQWPVDQAGAANGAPEPAAETTH